MEDIFLGLLHKLRGFEEQVRRVGTKARKRSEAE